MIFANIEIIYLNCIIIISLNINLRTITHKTVLENIFIYYVKYYFTNDR